jgi:hypothetical protein
VPAIVTQHKWKAGYNLRLAIRYLSRGLVPIPGPAPEVIGTRRVLSFGMVNGGLIRGYRCALPSMQESPDFPA